MAALGGKLTKNLVRTLGPGRHDDGSGLYLVVDPSGARRWIVRVTVKGQRNRDGKPLRTDFGLGGADVVTLNEARDRALEYRRLAKPMDQYACRVCVPQDRQIASIGSRSAGGFTSPATSLDREARNSQAACATHQSSAGRGKVEGLSRR